MNDKSDQTARPAEPDVYILRKHPSFWQSHAPLASVAASLGITHYGNHLYKQSYYEQERDAAQRLNPGSFNEAEFKAGYKDAIKEFEGTQGFFNGLKEVLTTSRGLKQLLMTNLCIFAPAWAAYELMNYISGDSQDKLIPARNVTRQSSSSAPATEPPKTTQLSDAEHEGRALEGRTHERPSERSPA